MQVKVSGIVPDRHVLLCKGCRIPLRSTGTKGEFVAGIRYKAWNPPSALHPNIGFWIARLSSKRSRVEVGDSDKEFLGEDNEWLVQYCKRKLETKEYNYFVFGHRHLPLEIELTENSKYINLGDWIGYFTYGVFDGEKMELKEFKN